MEAPRPLYPVTVTTARYGGIYEPGRWIAFASHPHELPAEWDADDVTCASFFQERRGEIGGGDTPQEAYDDLVRLLQERRGQS
jgi:hypothetical protein